MGQWSASAGPELAAARASLDGTAKKGLTGASVDLNSVANRQAAAGNKVGLSMPVGAGAPMQSNAGSGDSLQVLHSDATGTTSTNAGLVTRVVPLGSLPDGRASTGVSAGLPATVLRGQINPAARSCYDSDPDSKSKRPGRLVMAIKVAPAGEVDSVTVSSNVGVSPSVVTCITTAAGAAKFAPPGANGVTVRASFTFPGRDDLAPTAAARAIGAQETTNVSGHASHDALAKADTQPTNGETARR